MKDTDKTKNSESERIIIFQNTQKFNTVYYKFLSKQYFQENTVILKISFYFIVSKITKLF